MIQAKLNGPGRKVLIPVTGADLRRMFPTLLARTILCVAGRIVDRQLTRNIIYDARRNTLQVLQKCAQKTHGAELQSKSQAVVIATANRDELPIRIIQMEAPRQLLGR
jgi:hypothetical protein